MIAIHASTSSSLMNLDQVVVVQHELGELELCRVLEHEPPTARAEGVLHMRLGALLSEGESIYIRSPHFTGRLLCYGSRGARKRLVVSWGKFELGLSSIQKSDYRIACELRFADVQGEFRVDEQQVWIDNQYVARSQLIGEMTTTKMSSFGALIEVAIPDSISATFIIIELLHTACPKSQYRVESTGIYWYSEKLRTDKMLNQPSSEPPIPHDQPMIGRCLSCGTTVTCKFGDCKVIDDPPLGRVATIACPNVLHEMTAFDKTKQAGPIVRMQQQKRGGA